MDKPWSSCSLSCKIGAPNAVQRCLGLINSHSLLPKCDPELTDRQCCANSLWSSIPKFRGRSSWKQHSSKSFYQANHNLILHWYSWSQSFEVIKFILSRRPSCVIPHWYSWLECFEVFSFCLSYCLIFCTMTLTSFIGKQF